MDKFRYKTTAPLATKLPLAYSINPVVYHYVTVGRLTVPVLAGDLAIVQASGEASTQSGITSAMHGRFLKVSKTISPSPSEGTLISKAMTHNVTAAEHHSTMSCGGSYLATEGGDLYFSLVMYAAGFGGPNSTLSLLFNYVDLDVVILR